MDRLCTVEIRLRSEKNLNPRGISPVSHYMPSRCEEGIAVIYKCRAPFYTVLWISRFHLVVFRKGGHPYSILEEKGSGEIVFGIFYYLKKI